MPIKVFDFFSGCGGTSCGFRAAGLNIALAIDNNGDAARTFQANFADAVFLNRDIRYLSTEELLPYFHTAPDEQVLFSACAPCQPFSRQNGRRHGTDERISLLDEFARFVRCFEPEYIFVENVPGIQNIVEQGPLTDFVTMLREMNYRFVCRVISSQDYGVPQRRKRLVLVACRHYEIDFPMPTHGRREGLPPFSTVGNWIQGLPALNAGETHPAVPNHQCARLSAVNLERIQATPQNGDRNDWPEHLQLECHRNGHDGHYDVYGRMRRNQPSSALTTRCISLSNGRFGHPEEDRAISVREAACIQTFPRDFTLYGTMTSAARQIGNAVPVLLARRFGESLAEHAELHFGVHA